MAPITRLAFVAMLFSAAVVNAVPFVAPSDPNGPAPALTQTDSMAAAPESSHPEVFKRAGVNVIERCTKAGTVAITFDDGPFQYTNGLLDILKKKKVKATFFVNGNNNGKISSYKAVVRRAYKEGHQIASHTWSHQDLATLSNKKVTDEMTKLDTAVKSIIGVRPVYMRPPYGSTTPNTQNLLNKLGYTIVLWSQDTNDWRHVTDVGKSMKVYRDVLGKKGEIKKPGHIFLQHDIHKVTATILATQAIDFALSKGYKVVTVGECLGKPKSSWYRS
ncbi:hypothetical protein BG011_003539 [Mortierella polycephala]|uniref:NodB homology domain-containing protein n=1 Tax=Mortierella polycephala TaxID=41804 RepID=A0A9P6Q3W0_9FUNG|nr:hypothetical protein BG011_003539 [Mortierella polycephala]